MARKTDTFLFRKQVDLGPTEKGGAAKHGYRRRLTENVLFKWKAGDVVGVSGTTPATCVFSLPQASLTMTTKVLVQLTHVVPAAGGYEPKIYTHKTQKEIEKHVAREGKRFERMAEAGDESAGTFFVDGKKHPPQGVVAFAILPLTKFADGRDGGTVDLIEGTTGCVSMVSIVWCFPNPGLSVSQHEADTFLLLVASSGSRKRTRRRSCWKPPRPVPRTF